MKKLFSCIIPLLFIGNAQAQNVVAGTTTPQQKLDKNGAIRIGTTSSNQAGTIRFNTGKFEGGDGTTWKSFEGLPAKSIILARRVDTAEIKLAGFNVFKASTVEDTVQASFETNNAGQ